MNEQERVKVVLQMPRGRFEQIFAPSARERLQGLAELIGPGDSVQHADTLAERIAEADVLFVQSRVALDRAALDAAPRLRWIAQTSGSPPLVDYRAVFQRGIAVTDCRNAFHRSVAEMALALYLAVSRGVVAHDRALHTPDQAEGQAKQYNQEASFRTLGFVGFGGIAQMLVRFLTPFEPRLLAYDPYVSASTMAAAGAEAVSLPEVFRQSDSVFIVAMPNPQSQGLVGAAELDLLRPESILLVMSRSSFVDEAALIERLEAGRFRAAMDVFDREPLPAGHPYRNLPNVVLTPHRAGGTREAYWRIGQSLVDDLERFVAGQPPIHCVVVDEATVRRLGRYGDT
ncbi:MAG: hypothetical protein CL878_13455 [Dehalococcoidia bacterium]|nr:hypothetical protein [Dehalococcoidia bacterium]